MPVAFDANFLSILLLTHRSRIPIDLSTGEVCRHPRERIAGLIAELQVARDRIILPTPAVAEFLILAHPDGHAAIAELCCSPRIELAEFDFRAAIELAEMSVSQGNPIEDKERSRPGRS